MKWPIEKKTMGGFGLLLTILIIIGVISFQSALKFIETSRLETKTRFILKKLEIVLTGITDAETGQRGYIITGDERYLEPYYAATANISQEIKELRELTKGNPIQQSRLDALEPLLAEKLKGLKEMIDLRRNKGFEAAAKEVQTGKGRIVMDKIRKLIGEVENDEKKLLRQWMAETEINARRNIFIIIFGSSLALILVSISTFITYRGLTDRKRTEEALQKAYDELEQRVKERTAELGAINESLQREITERKQIEEKLETASNEWRATFDSATDLIILLDNEMRIIKANLATAKFFGTPIKEMLDKNFFQLFSVNGISLNTYPFENLKQAKKREEAELYLPERNIWIRISVDPILDGKGNIIRYVHIIRDITGRKQAEQEVRESETKYRRLVEQLPAITYTAALDEVSTTLYVSPQIKTFIGYSQEEYQVDPDIWRKRLHPDDRNRVLKEVTKSHASGEPFVSEYRMIGKDGRIVWFRDEALIIRDDAGRPLFLQGVMLDITNRKLVEEKLQAYQEQLRSLASQLSLIEEQERRRIATDLHDHIGQTLALCKIKVGTLRESTPTNLIESLDEIRDLIEQIIRYTRSLTFELSSPILYDLGFESAVEWLGEEILKEHGILFHFENDEQPKPLNDEARVLLFQAVRELLINIAKHAQAREAKVSVQRVGDDIRINIEDDGVGFDASEIDSYLKTIGFGLFSIRERLRHIKGYIEIKSEPGHGTKVTITVPLKLESGSA